MKNESINHHENENSNQSVDMVKYRALHTGIDRVIINMIMLYVAILWANQITYCNARMQGDIKTISQILRTVPLKCVNAKASQNL